MLLIAAVLKIILRQSNLHCRAILKGNSRSVFKVLLWYLPRDKAPFYQYSDF